MSLPGYVVPGQMVSHAKPEFRVGAGLEVFKGEIFATVLGRLRAETVSTASGVCELSIENVFQNPYVQRATDFSCAHNSRRSTSYLPAVGDIVYGQILRINTQQVSLTIIAVEQHGNVQTDDGIGFSPLGAAHMPSGLTAGVDIAELGEGYSALIRIQDIRATERDKIRVENQFRPGDIVRAVVLSMGDGQNFYLTTARPDLGVVFAKNYYTGSQLVPIDWQTMYDNQSGISFPRKVANPFA